MTAIEIASSPIPQLKQESEWTEKLDRLVWAAGLSFDVHGLAIGIRSTDPAALEELARLLPPGSRPRSDPSVDVLYSVIVGRGASQDAPGRRYYHVLYMNATRVVRTFEWDELKERLLIGSRVLVAYHAPHELFVAAGAVGYRGQATVVLGLGQIARTALVQNLVQAGCSYLSCDYAPVTQDRGLVSPFPTPLPLREHPSERATLRPVEALGGVAETQALPIGLVVVAEHRPGAQWRQREVSCGKGVLEMMAHTVAARGDPHRALQTLGRALPGATILEVRFGSIDEAANRLLAQPIWHSTIAPDGVPVGYSGYSGVVA